MLGGEKIMVNVVRNDSFVEVVVFDRDFKGSIGFEGLWVVG